MSDKQENNISIPVDNVQNKKIKFLLARGYRINSAKILMVNDKKMKVCTIDSYGLVEWWKPIVEDTKTYTKEN